MKGTLHFHRLPWSNLDVKRQQQTGENVIISRSTISLFPYHLPPLRVASFSTTFILSYTLHSFFLFFFYWRITALQYCVVFCRTATCVSHRSNMFPPSWTSLPPPTPSHSSINRLPQSTRFELPASYSKSPLAMYVTSYTLHSFCQGSWWRGSLLCPCNQTKEGSNGLSFSPFFLFSLTWWF